MQNSEPDTFKCRMAHLLMLAFSCTCLAYAWRINRYSCKTFSWLWSDNGFSDQTAGWVENGMILMLLIGAATAWIRRIRMTALVGILPMIFEFLAETFMTSAKYPLLYWAEWALRYSTPLAALLLFSTRKKAETWGIMTLRLATALVFASHGIKALLADPRFIDYILVFLRRAGLAGTYEAQALTVVHIIGTIDLLLALHLIILKLPRNRMVLTWMAAWGFTTAFARIMYGGWGNWHEVLIRTTHFISPMVLLLLINNRNRITAEQPEDIHP